MIAPRPTAMLACLALFLTAACSGGGTNTSTSSGSTGSARAPKASGAGGSSAPGDVEPVREPTRVSWVSTKHGERYVLINQAHPASRKPIPLEDKTKVITNIQMGALLTYLEDDVGFFDLASGNFSPRSVPTSRANGYISVERDGRAWGMVFLRGTKASESRIPNAYIESKLAIMGAFNRSSAPQAYTTRSGGRVLGIDEADPKGAGVREK